MTAIGERLKTLRTRWHMTQEELGRVFGMNPSTISLYESGKREPGLTEICKMADYFRVATDYLLGRTDQPDITPVTWKDRVVTIPALKGVEPGKALISDDNVAFWVKVPASELMDGDYVFIVLPQLVRQHGQPVVESALALVRLGTEYENGDLVFVSFEHQPAVLRRLYNHDGLVLAVDDTGITSRPTASKPSDATVVGVVVSINTVFDKRGEFAKAVMVP